MSDQQSSWDLTSVGRKTQQGDNEKAKYASTAAFSHSSCVSTATLVHHFGPDWNIYWMSCHGILYRHSWFPENKAYLIWWSSDFLSCVTSRSTFVVWTEMTWMDVGWIIMQFGAAIMVLVNFVNLWHFIQGQHQVKISSCPILIYLIYLNKL